MIMRYISLCFMLAVTLGLSACGDKDVILSGDRSSILDDIALPAVDADALAESANIGDQLPNIIYGHAGLLPSHAGGHLALDLPLQQQWLFQSLYAAVQDSLEFAFMGPPAVFKSL